MLQVFLLRTDRDGLFAFRSKGFSDLDSLARFFAEGGDKSWDRAEVVGHPRPYPAEVLRGMLEGADETGQGTTPTSRFGAASRN